MQKVIGNQKSNVVLHRGKYATRKLARVIRRINLNIDQETKEDIELFLKEGLGLLFVIFSILFAMFMI